MLAWIVGAVILAASTVLVAAALAESRGRLPFVYGALAVLQAGVLICFAGFADRGAVALLQLAYLGWLSIVRLSALVLAGLASVVDAVGFAIRVLVRLVAIPGDLLRGRLTSRAAAT